MTAALATAGLRTIRVYGTLARLIGRRKLRAAVSSVPEAMRFLLANFPQVEGHLKGRFFKVKVASWSLTEHDLEAPIGETEDVHIIPAISGAGGDGPLVGILAGAALIGVGLLVPFTGSLLVPLGIGLGLNGIAALLTPTPEVTDEDNDPARSYNFSGIQQTSREGVPVPLVYGDIVTGSVVLSVNVERDDEKLGTGDGEGIFEPGIGDNTYNLNERYPGVCWIYYSEVYLRFDDACIDAPGAAGGDRTLFGVWGDSGRGDYGGWQTATAPSGGTIIDPETCSGSLLKGYNNFTYDVLIDCAGNNQTNNPPYQNRPGVNTFLGGFGSAGLYPIGYRIWQGPIPPEASFHQQNPSLYANVPYRQIASIEVPGNELPTANLPNVYPNNPFE